MSQRLPRNYTPKQYDLFLHITPKQMPFEANVTITFQKNEDSDKAYLNIFPNIVIKSVIQNGIPLTYIADYPILTINSSTDPKQDISSYPITINYSLNPITYESHGFYQHGDNFFTTFEPNYAHILLPCFDDPIVRSTFSVKIQIPSNLMGLSNMPIDTTTPINDEKIITFQKTPPMCTYLLAVFIGTFTSIESFTKRGTPVKLYSEKEAPDILKKYLDAAIFAVNWMEEKTCVNYELPVLQLVSHSGLKVGMENYGLISLHNFVKYDDVEYNTLLVMHEVSHLWFGDLVSVKWWNSVWLNEGFAQYLMYLILRDFSKEYSNKAIQIFCENDGIRCLQYFESKRLVVDENEIDLNQDVLDSVIYIKGAFVLKMFSDIVGEVNFFKVCSMWMSTFKNKNADIDDFISLVNRTLNEDYSDFFNTWLRKIGFPMLNIVETYNKDNKINGVKISQSSFSGAIYQFKIPLLFEIDGKLNHMDLVMNEKEIEVKIKFDWIVVNNGMESLCSTFYSKVLSEKLCDANKAGKIDYCNSMLIQLSTTYVHSSDENDQEIIDLISDNF